MQTLRQTSRNPHADLPTRKSRTKRRTDAAARLPPARHPAVEICPPQGVAIELPASRQRRPRIAGSGQTLAYELLLAVPIRRKCFAMRLFSGQTNWSSFLWHRGQAGHEDAASARQTFDPFG